MKTTQITWRTMVAVVAVLVISCSEEDRFGSSSGTTSPAKLSETENKSNETTLADGIIPMDDYGYVYVEGNQLGTNQIFIFRYEQEGNLTFQGTVDSGGQGTGMGLESQGALTLSSDAQFLYAVNAGSDTISSFKVYPDGSLLLLDTIDSDGSMPISITVHDNHVYVVHAIDGTINGFYADSEGMFSHIPGSQHKLSDDIAGPAQISFSRNGRYLYVTEIKTNKISIFPVNNAGVAGMINSIASVGESPFGFDFARSNYIVVANAEMALSGASSVTSYSGVNSGNLNTVSAEIINGQTLTGRVACNRTGRYAYVSNSATDNLSAYYVGPSGIVNLIEANIESSDFPIDITVAANDYNVYVLCAKDQSVQEYVRTDSGSLDRVSKVGGVPESAAGIVSW